MCHLSANFGLSAIAAVPLSFALLLLLLLLNISPSFAKIASAYTTAIADETAEHLFNRSDWKSPLQNPSKNSDLNSSPSSPNTPQKTTTIRTDKSTSSAVLITQVEQRSRHRRRLPTGIIGKLLAKLAGKSGKVATTASKNSDGLFVELTKVGRISGRGTAPGRYYKSRGFDPPPFGSQVLPTGNDLGKRARTNALAEGTKVALASAGVVTAIWYFGGENAALYILLIVGGAFVALILALSLLFYLFTCQRRKKGYYAVNEQMAAAFAKKLLFYLFC